MAILARDCEEPRSTSSAPESPLSSPRDLDLSDSSFYDHVRLVEAEGRLNRQPQTGQAADRKMAQDADPGDATNPKLASHPIDDDDDELVGDPIPPESTQDRGSHDRPADPTGGSLPTVESTSASAPTRRMPNRQKKIIIKQSPKKTPRKIVWTTERLLTDPKSPLVKADLRSIVASPLAWDILDTQTRTEILALFPHQHMVLDAGTENARPDFAAMMNDDSFRGDCASYIENISSGRHDHDWLTSAYHAHHRRKMGDFDDFLVQRVQGDWGVELPDAFKPRRAPRIQEDIAHRENGEEKHKNECTNMSEEQLKTGEQDVSMESG